MAKPIPKIGRPLFFSEPQELLDLFLDYLDDCKTEKNIPTVAGFRSNKVIPRTTYYEYEQKPEYSNTFGMIADFMEDITVNNRDIDSATKNLVLKSKHKYADKQEIDIRNETITVSISKDDE